MLRSVKTTLTEFAANKLRKSGMKVSVLNGDVVRAKYILTRGFSGKVIECDNTYTSKYYADEKLNYDGIIVLTISPINRAR